MKRLILLRHGHAMNEPAIAGGGDHQRALSQRGRAEALHIAEHLRGCADAINAIYVSDARRTQETANIVTQAAQLDGMRVDDERLYLASCGDMLAYANQLPAAHETVMFIGHNPGLYELAALLLTPEHHASILNGFPPCTLTVLGCDISRWDTLLPESASLLAYQRP